MNTISYIPPKHLEYSSVLEKVYKLDSNLIRAYTIAFQVTENCNMACTYCYQHHKTSNKMTWDTAKLIIDKLLNDEFELINKNNCFTIIYDFIGGEPFLEIDLIDKIVSYTIEQMIKLNHPWQYYFRFSICSNGLLYNTPKVQKFLKKYYDLCSFCISIDGNQELHDQCRIDLQQNPTYNRAISAVRQYKKVFKKTPYTKMTLSPDNVNYVYEALINLIKEGYEFIPINCIFEKGWDYSHAKILYSELKKVADYLIDNNLYNKVNIKMFNEEQYCPMSEDNNRNWCGGVEMKSAAFNYSGNIYPCIRYMESSVGDTKPLSVGNIHTGLFQTIQEKENLKLISNITRRSQSTDECFYCPIAEGCSWCSAYNYEEFGTPNKRATYICIMHQATSLANVYYWNKLYKYLSIDKVFKMHLPKEKALEIINENEYNYLLNLSKR